MTYGIEDILLLIFTVLNGIIASMMLIRSMLPVYGFENERDKKDYLLGALFLVIITAVFVYCIIPAGRDEKLIVCTSIITMMVPVAYGHTRYVYRTISLMFRVRKEITRDLIRPNESWMDPDGEPYSFREPKDKEQK